MDAMAVYTIMALAGLLYAAGVYLLREADPDHGLTPWLVVVGDGLVVLGIYMRLGQAAAVELLVLLAITGVPQIVGYTLARTLRRRKAEAKPATRADDGLGLR